MSANKTDLTALIAAADQIAASDDEAVSGPKALRDAYDAMKVALKDVQTENASLKATGRNTSLETLLTAKGGKSSWSKYVPEDVPATDEGITSWLAANGEDFGWTPPTATQGADPSAAQQAAATQQGAQVEALVGDAAKIAALQDMRGKGFDAALQFIASQSHPAG